MDINQLMKQAEALQGKVAAGQEKLAGMILTGTASGGLVIVELTGKYDLVKLTISPALLRENADDVAAMISAAYRDAKTKVDAAIDSVMNEATGGMSLPQ